LSDLEASAFGVARSALRLLGRLEIAAVILSLVIICFLTGAAIVLRYGFDASLLWGEEVSLLLMKIMIFLGAAAIYKGRAFICVGLVFDAVPGAVQYLLSVLAWIAAMVFAAVVVWQGILLYPTQINVRTYLLELPKFYFTVPLIFGAASIFLTSAYYAAYTAIHSRPRADRPFTDIAEDHVILARLGERT